MDETSRQFMMWGGLMLTVIVFSAIAFFIVTRPGFKNRGEGGGSGTNGASEHRDITDSKPGSDVGSTGGPSNSSADLSRGADGGDSGGDGGGDSGGD